MPKLAPTQQPQRAYLITIEAGRILIRAFAPPFCILQRGQEHFLADFSIAEADAIVELLRQELGNEAMRGATAASAVTVAEDGGRKSG